MKFQRKKREKVDITFISLIDVLFVLLLFFMISTTFNRYTEIKIKLPEADAEEADHDDKTVTLEIDADGVYYLQDRGGHARRLVNQDRQGLQNELSRLAGGSDLPFVISADGKTPHQAVVTALEAAGNAGFNHITFAAQRPAS